MSFEAVPKWDKCIDGHDLEPMTFPQFKGWLAGMESEGRVLIDSPVPITLNPTEQAACNYLASAMLLLHGHPFIVSGEGWGPEELSVWFNPEDPDVLAATMSKHGNGFAFFYDHVEKPVATGATVTETALAAARVLIDAFEARTAGHRALREETRAAGLAV